MFDLGRKLRSLDGPVLITGHTGFKGTWLSLYLNKLGIDTIGVSLPDESNYLSTKIKMNFQEQFFLDISNFEDISALISHHKPSIIFHLAAESLLSRAQKYPFSTFNSNTVGTLNILEGASRSTSVQAVLVTTTDKVYRNSDLGLPFTEQDALEGSEVYSASKVAAEAIIKGWQTTSESNLALTKFKLISARSGNVIGGGDLAENRLMPDIVKHVYFNEPLHIRNLYATRPWLHVLDTLTGYILAIEAALNGKNPKSFNFGPKDSPLRVRDVIEISENFFSSKFRILSGGVNILEKSILELNSDLATSQLAWSPQLSQKDSILLTLKWWQRTQEEKLSQIHACEIEIESYLKKLN